MFCQVDILSKSEQLTHIKYVPLVFDICEISQGTMESNVTETECMLSAASKLS